MKAHKDSMEQGSSMNNASRVFLRDEYERFMDWCIVAKMEDFDYLFTWMMGATDKHITSFLTLLSGGLVQCGEDGKMRIFDYLLSDGSDDLMDETPG